ncbi:MAG: DUF4412 domain-containing protein [Syntrophobacteraceae bacterium]|nr:DUF4412 domain-containing protein [Syntrophobacteraceae bacterium]
MTSSPAFGAEFSADIAMKPKGEQELQSKIYVKDKKIRHELTEDGETQIIVFRPDKGVVWTIIPEEKMYVEAPMGDSEKTLEEWTPEKEKKAKSLGDDTVSGYPCKKYELVEDGEKVTFWVSKKFPFPIKVQDEEAVIEYRNIKEGAVADSVFEVPAGYEKMSMTEMPGSKAPGN